MMKYDGLGLSLWQKLKLAFTGTRLYGAYVLLRGGCVMQNITVRNGTVETDGRKRGWVKGNLFIHCDVKESAEWIDDPLERMQRLLEANQ